MAMKKVLAFLLAILMIVPLASCNKTEEPEVTTEPVNPGTSDSAIFIVVALIAVALVSTVIVRVNKREE